MADADQNGRCRSKWQDMKAAKYNNRNPRILFLLFSLSNVMSRTLSFDKNKNIK